MEIELKPTKSMTLALIGTLAPKASIKEIISQYKELGIYTYRLLLMRHIKELIEEGKIYQVNPGQKRYKFYRKVIKTSNKAK